MRPVVRLIATAPGSAQSKLFAPPRRALLIVAMWSPDGKQLYYRAANGPIRCHASGKQVITHSRGSS